ncbi:MAG: DNA repair protein RadA [Chloroflexi bacterium RBG_13_51_18]|nr:MAG: DNA repair protein RadA [Chloroflexi bacterium RBG_13_51_18]
MSKSSSKVVYVCKECGKESLKWLGKCPECNQWNTFGEMTLNTTRASSLRPAGPQALPQELSQVELEAKARRAIPLEEFNRVLGGGLVAGSLVLISGDPGIGKSTLLLQAAASIADERHRVVYVTGEETAQQIKLRAQRLRLEGEGLFIMAETDIDAVIEQAEQAKPALVIIDSIQTVYIPGGESAAGSVSQVRDCTMRMMQWAKTHGVPVFISGHVTKEGAIAGPKVLEHIVDVVLYLEGEPFSAYRLLRCVKNRFGSTNEVGVFEMKEEGMVEVANPSLAFLSQRGAETVGSAVVPVIEGSRPLLVEIQALTTINSFGQPRRTANGVDFNRLLLVTAVLSRRVGLKLGNQDIIVNVAGGLKVGEPAADLGIALAIASSYKDAEVMPQTAAVGEVGLSGELRPAPQMDRRLAEAARLGFKKCIIPKTGAKVNAPKDMEIIIAGTLREAVYKGVKGGGL